MRPWTLAAAARKTPGEIFKHGVYRGNITDLEAVKSLIIGSTIHSWSPNSDDVTITAIRCAQDNSRRRKMVEMRY